VRYATAAILELGALVGALVCGTYSDSMSRRKAIRLACGEPTFSSNSDVRIYIAYVAVFCVGSAIQTAANTQNQLGLGRFIGGIGIGSLRCRRLQRMLVRHTDTRR
jgi:MFS family permease